MDMELQMTPEPEREIAVHKLRWQKGYIVNLQGFCHFINSVILYFTDFEMYCTAVAESLKDLSLLRTFRLNKMCTSTSSLNYS